MRLEYNDREVVVGQRGGVMVRLCGGLSSGSLGCSGESGAGEPPEPGSLREHNSEQKADTDGSA